MKNKQLILDDLKNGLSVDKIAKKYNVTTRTVYNYKRQLKNISASEKSESESQNETESISDKTPEINTPESISNKSLDDTVSNVDIESEDEKNEKYVNEKNDCSLADILNDDNEEQKDEMNENIIEKNDFVIPEPKPRIKSMSSIKSVKKKQIEKDFKPIEIKNDISDDIKLKNQYMTQIRKYISFFKNEQSIKNIIGITDKQVNVFVKSLYNKDINTLKSICDMMKFELIFTKSQDYVHETIKTSLQYFESLLSYVGLDVVGCSDDMFNDDEFIWYLQMASCEINIQLEPSQIVLLKFMKNYYMQYHKNKTNKIIDKKLNKPANENIIEKYKDL